MRSQALDSLPTSTSGRTALQVAFQAAQEAGNTLLDRFHGEKEVRFKGRANLVSDVDLQTEHQIIETLKSEFPDTGFLPEESKAVEGNSGYTWVIDPLDGTRNYVQGIPFFSLVIALAKGDEPLVGLTYDPVRGEMFHAVKGEGAFLNGNPINVSKKTTVEQALLGYDLGYVDDKASTAIEMILHLWPNVQGTRILGSAALGLAYAACGRLDLYFHHNLSSWDVASGILLTREAGGIITDKYATPANLRSESIITSNVALHRAFLKATDGLAWRQ